jgi:phosphoglycolate phosphatase
VPAGSGQRPPPPGEVGEIDAILLDLDGVIVDSRVPFTRSVNAALRAHGLPEREEAELYRFIGPPLHATFTELVGDARLTAALIDAYRARYRAHAAGETPVMPGMAPVLARLAAQVPLVVATSKPQALAEPLLAALGLRDRFRAVVGPSLEAVAESKSRTVQRALAHVAGCDRIAMVGDRRFDMLAAREHGLLAVGALWGIGSRAELLEAGAERLVERPEALVPLLLGRAG